MKPIKAFVALLFAIVCVCTCALAVACAEEEKTYSVTFDVKGHGEAPETITGLAAGSLVEKPEDPECEGYVFNGWFKDRKCTDDWNFETDTVTEDIILFALWDTQKYTVTFDVKGHGEAPAAITGLEKGAGIQKPEDPECEGYVFNGWYKDGECTEQWNFSTDKIDGDATLYAAWQEIYPVDNKATFDRNVDGAEYFSVAAAGNYAFTLTFDGGEAGAVKEYRLDGEAQFTVLGDGGTGNQTLYLAKGVHKIEKADEGYAAKIALDALDMPFNEVVEFFGETCALKVATAGGEDTVPTVRFGYGSASDQAHAISFDGEFYTLTVKEMNGGVYEYYQIKIKINVYNDSAHTVEVYTKTGDEWNTRPDDVLELAKTAAEVSGYLNINGLNECKVENSFQYVYFTLLDNKYKWLEFSGVADGTKFYWVDVNASRTGDLGAEIEIVNGEPVKIANGTMYDHLNHIAVKPAGGADGVSFSVREVPEPAPDPGLSEDNPIVLTANEPFVLKKGNKETPYYFSFTPEAAGDYFMSVYYESSDGTKYKVQRCNVDNIMNYLPFRMPSVEELANGKQVTLAEKTYKFSVLIGGGGGQLTVSIEKIEKAEGGIEAGTYVGGFKHNTLPFTYDFTFVVNDENSMTVTRQMKLGDNNYGDPVTSEPRELVDDGSGFYVDDGSGSYTIIIDVGDRYRFVITPVADGSLTITYDKYTFTAVR